MDKKKEEKKNSRNTKLDEFGVVESSRCSKGKDVVCKNGVKGIDFLVARLLYAIRISRSLIAHSPSSSSSSTWKDLFEDISLFFRISGRWVGEPS